MPKQALQAICGFINEHKMLLGIGAQNVSYIQSHKNTYWYTEIINGVSKYNNKYNNICIILL